MECFVCGRPMRRQRYPCYTVDGQQAWCGADCCRKLLKAGPAGLPTGPGIETVRAYAHPVAGVRYPGRAD